jgi:hypothetical protein
MVISASFYNYLNLASEPFRLQVRFPVSSTMQMKIKLLILAVIVMFFLSPAMAEDEPDLLNTHTILVFMDCQGMARQYCDFDHVRREIQWVHWARDRKDADLHLLITAERAGGQASRYGLDYINLASTDGTSISLTFISDPDVTASENRDTLTRKIALGLIQFVASSPISDQLRIEHVAQPDQATQTRTIDDPWKLWTFRVSSSGRVNGEKLQRGHTISGTASANRTTEQFKLDWFGRARTSRSEFDIDDDTFVNTTRNHRSELLAVWSLSEQWSLGGTTAVAQRSFDNLDFALSGGPAIEYNIFPYTESTRQLLTFRYSVEIVRNNYDFETVTGKFEETLGRHRLRMSTQMQQPWGEVFGVLSVVQYFHDTSAHRIDFFMGSSFRIFRGFSLDISGSFSRIKDQFFLPATGSTPEEILLQRRQRETDFRFRASLGFSYRFGSKVANIVNPRLQN